jgi:hypothetical protein
MQTLLRSWDLGLLWPTIWKVGLPWVPLTARGEGRDWEEGGITSNNDNSYVFPACPKLWCVRGIWTGICRPGPGLGALGTWYLELWSDGRANLDGVRQGSSRPAVLFAG